MPIHEVANFLSEISAFFKKDDARTASKDSLELSVTERIWGDLQELVIAIADLFGIAEEDIYGAVINRSDEMSHICIFTYLQIKTRRWNLRNLNNELGSLR